MANQKAKRKVGAKKKFFEVEVPLTASKAHLYGYEAEEFNNKVITLDLTRNLRGKNLEFKTKIIYENGNLSAKLISLQLIPTYIKKVMRRGIDYVEDSFVTECKDGKIVIKPFMITRNRVSRKIRNTLRENAKKHLIAHCTMRSLEELFQEVISNKLQRELSLKLKKVYPLALCEIRMLEIQQTK